MFRALLALALGSCEVATGFVEHHGDVYECQATASDVLELCTDLDHEELEHQTGWDCWPTTRLWPHVVGCVYRCGVDAPGYNAHAGCFCPE